MPVISILDYGAGNLQSVRNALDVLNAPYTLVHSPTALSHATKIIFPGVGHFGQMIRALDAMQIRASLIDRLNSGIPFLGICLGLQSLFESSEEAPDFRGLGVFPGTIQRFSTDARVPHMGWNELTSVNDSRLLRGLGAHPSVYFAHSYYAPMTPATAATCTYTTPYTAVLESGNIFGVQFHPEKSGPIGLQIVRNFIEL